MISESELVTLARSLGMALKAASLRLATAESCTGGWVAKVVTDIEGSSDWFERGFVTYTNDAKCEMLGVSAETLTTHGAVSEATVQEMAQGALQYSHADISLAISGIAGPGGGSVDKPVGTVCLAWAGRDSWQLTRQEVFVGDRRAIRMQAVFAAMQGVLQKMSG